MNVRSRLRQMEAKILLDRRKLPQIAMYDATRQSEQEINADIQRRYREAGYTYRPGDPVLSIIVDPYPDALVGDPEAEGR